MPLAAFTFLSEHLKGDVAYYLLFFAGQCMFILKRCAMAVRSKTNPIKTRRGYVAQNWDILGIRTIVEFPVFFIWRHYTLSQIMAVFHMTWSLPFSQNAGGPFTYFLLGFASDGIFDWISTSDRTPGWVRDWIKEQVPNIPATITTTTIQTLVPQQIGVPVTTTVSSETVTKDEAPKDVVEKLEQKQEDK